MKKALIYGILASFFFAFTFILNRSMNLAGGYWMWAASLRYLFTFPILWIMLAGSPSAGRVWSAVKEAPVSWLVWSTVGFGLFYAPLTFGSVLGILAGSGYLAADHSGWRAFDAVIWKKNTNPEPGVVCSRTGRRIYDAGASSEADGGEDCALYAGANTGGGIFLSSGEP